MLNENDDEEADLFNLNVTRAGELFIKSLWIQGQMADLNIFAGHPDLVAPFIASMTLPPKFATLRFKAWQSDFSPVKAEFITKFRGLLTDNDLEDLEFLNGLRNAIGHSHVSIAQDFFLYRPRTKSEDDVYSALLLHPREHASDPMIVKLSFTNDEHYLACHDRIRRIDENALATVAASLGVKQSRIR